MKVLITGITGLAGSCLAEYILSLGGAHEIYGTVRWRSRVENIEKIRNNLILIDCDVRDSSSVRKLLQEVKPDIIFHFAAQSSVFASWHAPSDTMNTNITGLLNVFESLRSLGLNPVVLVPGSSEEYGFQETEELPIKETNQLRPLSPYAVSKVAQDLLGYQYFMSYKLNVVRTRAFNHTGARRPDIYVESNFARQIAEMEKGLRPGKILVGNLQAMRDFTDVRDVVRAYWIAVNEGKAGEVYNICSGKSYSIEEVLNKLIEIASVEVEVEQEPSRLRPYDAPHILGDSSRFRELTGWHPEIPFEKTLESILNYWRENLLRPNS